MLYTKLIIYRKVPHHYRSMVSCLPKAVLSGDVCFLLQLLKKWETRERKKMRDYEKEKDREDDRKTEEVGSRNDAMACECTPRCKLYI